MTAVLFNPYRLGGFSPSDIAGLELWLKSGAALWQDSARTTPAAADGDPVGAWDDSHSPANGTSQATSTKRPLLKTGILNGLPALRYDGVDDTLTLSTGVALTGAFTIYAVGMRRLAAKVWTPLGNTVSGKAGILIFSDNNIYVGTDANLSVSAAYTGPNAAGILARFARDASDSVTFKSTGMAATTLGTRSGTLTFDSVGARPGVSHWTDGDFEEILVYSADLSAGNRTFVETYLTAKYGVTF